MKRKIILLLFIFCYQCYSNSEIYNLDFIKKIATNYFDRDFPIIIPVYNEGDKEYIIIENNSVYNHIFVTKKNEYASYYDFLVDIIEGKLKINIKKYDLNYYDYVNYTAISEEYKDNGIDFILQKYMTNMGLTKNNYRKYKIKDILPTTEENDLMRILFLNCFLKFEADYYGYDVYVKIE